MTLDDLYQEIWKIIDDLLSNMVVFQFVIVKLPNGMFIIWETTQQYSTIVFISLSLIFFTKTSVVVTCKCR